MANQNGPQLVTGPRPLRQTWGTYLAGKLLGLLFIWPWLLLLLGPITTTAAKTDYARQTGEPVTRWPVLAAASRFLWISGLMLLGSVLLLPLLLFTVPMTLVMAGRVAARPFGVTVPQLLGAAREVRDGSDRWTKAGWVALGALGVAALAFGVAAVGDALLWNLPFEFVWAMVVPLVVAFGISYAWMRAAGHRLSDRKREADVELANLLGRVAGLLGITQKRLVEDGLAPQLDGAGGLWLTLPASVEEKGSDAFEAKVATFLPHLEVVEFGESAHLAPLTDETRDRRRALAESNGLVEAVEPLDDAPGRTNTLAWTLSAGLSPTVGAQLHEMAMTHGGRSLVQMNTVGRRAIVAQLTDTQVQVRQAIAAGLGVAETPWLVEVALDEQNDLDAPVSAIHVLRMPSGTLTAKRAAAWQEALMRVPGGHPDWTIIEEPGSGTAVLTYRPPRRLPTLVPAAELIAAPGDAVVWSKIPLGRTDAGTDAVLDLKAGPHSLIVGGTGSGKSVASRLLVLQALTRGFEVVYCDPTKKGAGLRDYQPHVKVWATESKAQVASVMDAVYSEVRRRVDLIDEAGVEDWTELDGVKPWLVVLDEFRGLTAMPIKPAESKGDKADAYSAAVETRDTIIGTMGLMAAEARSAGVHLVVLTQRPDAKIIEGEIRENLGSVIQLIPAGRPPSPEALRMTFTDAAADAVEEMNALKNGRPGFALSFIDGGGVRGFRVGLLEPAAVPQLLAEHAIPAGVPLDYKAPKSTGTRAQFGTEIADDETVVEYDDLDFSDFNPSDFE